MNLPRMITALSAAHACMTDKFNWKEEGEDITFHCERANEVINSECACDLLNDETIAIIVSAVMVKHKCPDHRVYELAHFLYHLLPESDMARPNFG